MGWIIETKSGGQIKARSNKDKLIYGEDVWKLCSKRRFRRLSYIEKDWLYFWRKGKPIYKYDFKWEAYFMIRTIEVKLAKWKE